MPWTGQSFKDKHNHSLSDDQAEKASRVANAILQDSGDEGKAIRIANSIAEKHPKVHAPYHSNRSGSK